MFSVGNTVRSISKSNSLRRRVPFVSVSLSSFRAFSSSPVSSVVSTVRSSTTVPASRTYTPSMSSLLPSTGSTLYPSLTPLPHETLVFVYGSLLKGLTNHHRLQRNDKSVRYLGPACTIDKYCMIGLGFPILSSTIPKHRIYGELYGVQPSVLESLDQLEGHPDAYVRTVIKVEAYPSLHQYTSDIFTNHTNSDDRNTGTGAQAVPSESITLPAPVPIEASIYLGDIFWELEGGHDNFLPLEVPHGNFRLFWEQTNQTGWQSIIDTVTKEKKRAELPHPLPIDEPVVAFSLSSFHNESFLDNFLRTNAGKVRYLGIGEILSASPFSSSLPYAGKDSSVESAKVYFIPPRLLLELDKLYGYSPVPVSNSSSSDSSNVRRVPRQVRMIQGVTTATDTNENGNVSIHTSRGSAALDWVPGGNPVPGDVLYVFNYTNTDNHPRTSNT